MILFFFGGLLVGEEKVLLRFGMVFEEGVSVWRGIFYNVEKEVMLVGGCGRDDSDWMLCVYGEKLYGRILMLYEHVVACESYF
jgi:hypothetical protein